MDIVERAYLEAIERNIHDSDYCHELTIGLQEYRKYYKDAGSEPESAQDDLRIAGHR